MMFFKKKTEVSSANDSLTKLASIGVILPMYVEVGTIETKKMLENDKNRGTITYHLFEDGNNLRTYATTFNVQSGNMEEMQASYIYLLFISTKNDIFSNSVVPWLNGKDDATVQTYDEVVKYNMMVRLSR